MPDAPAHPVIDDVAAPVVQQLRDLREPEPPAEGDVEDGIVAHADHTLAPCLHALGTRVVPSVGLGDAQTLSIQQERLMLSALSRMDHDRVIGGVDRVLVPIDSDDARAAACRVLGRVGTVDELDRIVALATPREADAPLTRRMRAAFRDAVAQLLDEPDVADELHRTWNRLPDPLIEPAIQAVGDARDPRSLALLAELATWRDEWATLAIGQVRLVGRSLDASLNEAMALALVGRIEDGEQNVAEAACLALGELRSEEHLDVLIAALERGTPVVRDAASRALARYSGQRFPANAHVWRVWYDRESQDAAAQLESLERALSRATPEDQLAHALRRCTQRRLLREQFAYEIEVALDHPSADVRLAAVEALTALDSPTSVDALTGCLYDEDDRVHDAAQAALRAITGHDAIESAEDWRDWIEAHTDLY